MLQSSAQESNLSRRYCVDSKGAPAARIGGTCAKRNTASWKRPRQKKGAFYFRA